MATQRIPKRLMRMPIQAEGIKPDVLIEPAKLEIAKASDNFKEADLKGHLVNPNDKAAEATNTFAPATDDNQSLSTPTVEPEIKDPGTNEIMKELISRSI